jgi:molecular chaperone IbpA
MNKTNQRQMFDQLLADTSGDFSKTTVGMKHYLRELSQTLGSFESYPPYNFEQLSDVDYRITYALSGFKKDEIDITFKEDMLIIEGKKAIVDETDTIYLHRGIATRSFIRSFKLALDIVIKDAAMNDGLLVINLERIVPEEKKPKTIKIQ